MVKGYLFVLLFTGKEALGRHDKYTERVSVYPLTSTVNLVELSFETRTESMSSHFLDLFPQSVASVLIANKGAVEAISGRIVRGRWKWAEDKRPSYPTGSSMFLKTTKGHEQRSVLWTQTAWLFSSVLAGSFESLAPEQKSFSWITPMDLGDNVRVGFNPSEPLCTDNLKRFTDLLPCRSRSGLGKRIMEYSLQMARSEYLAVSLEARSLEDVDAFVLYGKVTVVLPQADTPTILSAEELCAAAATNQSLNSTISGPRESMQSIRVLRSLTGSELGPERRYGQLVISLVNRDILNQHSIEIKEQLPYFLVPLWHTYHGPPPESIRWSQSDSPTYIKWNLRLEPGERKNIVLSLYKKFLPMSAFSYSFEKGFDVGSAAYRIDNSSEWSLTRGLVVVVPLPDQTSTFNAIAVAVTPIGLLFGMIFRSFLDKRSELLDEKKSDERDPPLFRLIRWLFSRLRV
jgi:hypothetical protein